MIAGTFYLDQEHHNILIPEVMRTSNPFERMRGLLGRTPLENNQALLIKPCSSIHTFFMPYALDLVFLDKSWRIHKLVPAVKPWRMARAPGAAMVLEMPAGSMDNMSLAPGQTLYWKEREVS